MLFLGKRIRYNAGVSFLSKIFPHRHRPTLEELETTREHRADGIRGVIGVTTLILLVLVSFLLSTLVLSPLLELHGLKRQLQTAKAQLRHAQKEEAEARDRFIWMQDPEYFEQIARERANQAKPGETVIRFAPRQAAPQPPAPKKR